jgi:hypothetical protein
MASEHKLSRKGWWFSMGEILNKQAIDMFISPKNLIRNMSERIVCQECGNNVQKRHKGVTESDRILQDDSELELESSGQEDQL